MKNIFLITSIN